MNRRALIIFGLLITLFFIAQEIFSPEVKPPAAAQVAEAKETQPKETPNPNYYVLQNSTMQLVFSDIGGALAEINLPLASPQHPESAIREVEVDRLMTENPLNDRFPLFPYYTPDDGKPQLETSLSRSGYTPLIRRNLVGPNGRITYPISPRYFACNTISLSRPGTATLSYKLIHFDAGSIEFQAEEGNRRITKRYVLPQEKDSPPYIFHLYVTVEGENQDLWLTSGVPEVEMISGNPAPSLTYHILRNNKAEVEEVDLPKTATAFSSIEPDYVCTSNGFFGLILDPLTSIGSGFRAERVEGQTDPSRLVLLGTPSEKYPGYEFQLPLRRSSETQQFRIFAGPFDRDILDRVDAAYSNPSIGYTGPGYSDAPRSQGWFAKLSGPFSQFLFLIMRASYFITHSWGISILLLTIALRLMLYPLNAWSIRSTARLQELSPKIAAIQERYKKDPKRAQMEVLALYREKGANPLSGCLPLLIQLPFLIGMFDLLKSNFDLRGASFIPFWIPDLTAPDHTFSWGFNIPFLGSEFHLLPILIGAVMYWQQKFTSPAPKDKRLLTDQQKQQRMMSNIMMVVFTVMFYSFPAGLNIYWLFSMILGILQQWFMLRKRKQAATTVIAR